MDQPTYQRYQLSTVNYQSYQLSTIKAINYQLSTTIDLARWVKIRYGNAEIVETGIESNSTGTQGEGMELECRR